MKIVAAMSGGVDSCVAAYLLKQQGHDVIGVTIKTWPKEECGAVGDKMCCSLDSIQYARSAAEDMGFPHYVIDLSEEFANEVKKYFVDEYRRGRTPNPCVNCNSKIKFGYLIDKALALGAEKVATGHYARIVRRGEDHFLASARNAHNDQTYFLYDIPRDRLKLVEFPLGDLEKPEVREIALSNGFMSARRKSSQDVCFATGDKDYREYLKEGGLEIFVPGDILDMSGKVVGRHEGIVSYTIGQRKGLGVATGKPQYVLKIDPVRNTVTIGNKEEAMKGGLVVAGVNWLLRENERSGRRLEVMIRYNGERTPADIEAIDGDKVMVRLEKEQFAPTPGQAAVFYDGDLVAGGGWIESVCDIK
ncbi:MAG: tRNA 2-thiouridine(34) synthase MnmA [Candidatus Omnitrophica bacterium]|nr:tRNA 2-thiouridine(34) synthase MnmA [Candidatus Omnitrophota bacterium]MDD5488646.1 tRNA 2-thiouridine(34) synthase MnmA [Candidatus Omnitrophota bacterium]